MLIWHEMHSHWLMSTFWPEWGPREDPVRTLYMVRGRRMGFIRVVGMLLVVVDIVLLLLVINQVVIPLQISFFGSSLVILGGHPVL